MVRTGHPPRTSPTRRLWRCADLVSRYAINLMLALAVLAAALAA